MWNDALVPHIAAAFLKGIERLKEKEFLQFRLIEYIPLPSDFNHNRYCKRIVEHIICGAKSMNILRSRTGEWISPNQAVITSTEVIDGTPLFDDEDIRRFHNRLSRKFVSREYRQTGLLEELGCIRFTSHDVRLMIQRRDFAFPEKSNEWIAKLFIYLFQSVKNDRDHLLNLRFLKARTADGRTVWLSRKDHIVLSNPIIKVPEFIELTTLDADFEAAIRMDSHAKYFLDARLGVHQISYAYIVQQIISAHRTLTGNSECAEILLHHARYLYQNGIGVDFGWAPFNQFRLKLQSGFHFLNHKNGHDIAANLVQDTEFDIGYGRQCRLSEIASPRIRILSAQYNSMPKLLTFFAIPKFPALSIDDELSDFFKLDLAPATRGDNHLLHLLVEEELWTNVPIPTRTALYSELRKIRVRCTDGTFQPLETCFLPTSELAPLLYCTNILDLVDPDDRKWAGLKSLGVTLQPDAKLYLGKLRQLKGQTISDIAAFKDDVIATYIALLKYYREEDKKLVWFIAIVFGTNLSDTFNQDSLLLTKVVGETPTWMRPLDVLKHVPSFCGHTMRFDVPCLTATPKNTLCEILSINAWDDEQHLLAELEAFQRRGPLVSQESCQYVFVALKHLHLKRTSPTPFWINQILQLPIFPIKNPDGTSSFGAPDDRVFVADSPSLNHHIVDQVRVLDFCGQDIYAVLPLLRLLPLNFISLFETSKRVQIGGTTSLHATANYLLRQSKGHIARSCR